MRSSSMGERLPRQRQQLVGLAPEVRLWLPRPVGGRPVVDMLDPNLGLAEAVDDPVGASDGTPCAAQLTSQGDAHMSGVRCEVPIDELDDGSARLRSVLG